MNFWSFSNPLSTSGCVDGKCPFDESISPTSLEKKKSTNLFVFSLLDFLERRKELRKQHEEKKALKEAKEKLISKLG